MHARSVFAWCLLSWGFANCAIATHLCFYIGLSKQRFGGAHADTHAWRTGADHTSEYCAHNVCLSFIRFVVVHLAWPGTRSIGIQKKARPLSLGSCGRITRAFSHARVSVLVMCSRNLEVMENILSGGGWSRGELAEGYAA